MSTGVARHKASGSPLPTIGFWVGMTVAFVLGWLAVYRVTLHMTSRSVRPAPEPELGSRVAESVHQESVDRPTPVAGIAATESRDTSTPMPASSPNPETESIVAAEEAPVVPIGNRNEDRAPRDAYRKTLDALSALYE